MSKLSTSVTNLFHQFQKCFVTIFQTLTALHANHWTLHNNPCLFSTILESKLFFVYSNLNENKTKQKTFCHHFSVRISSYHHYYYCHFLSYTITSLFLLLSFTRPIDNSAVETIKHCFSRMKWKRIQYYIIIIIQKKGKQKKTEWP